MSYLQKYLCNSLLHILSDCLGIKLYEYVINVGQEPKVENHAFSCSVACLCILPIISFGTSKSYYLWTTALEGFDKLNELAG